MQWISVKERLPMKHKRVLVTDGVDVCIYPRSYLLHPETVEPVCGIKLGEIVWWMPLPQAIGFSPSGSGHDNVYLSSLDPDSSGRD